MVTFGTTVGGRLHATMGAPPVPTLLSVGHRLRDRIRPRSRALRSKAVPLGTKEARHHDRRNQGIPVRAARRIGQPGTAPRAVRQLHRWRWVAPVKGKYEVDLAPATGLSVHRGPALHGRRCRARPGCGSRREDRLGRDLRDRACPRAQRHRGRDRRQQRDARGRRELGQRQAGPRDACRGHPACRGPLPLLRRRPARRRGLDHRARQGHRRLPLP